MIKTAWLIVLFLSAASSFASDNSRGPNFPLKTVDEILRNTTALQGGDYTIIGFGRFDQRGRRGLLYRNLRELRKHSYRDAIFLQMDHDSLWKQSIPDKAYVTVKGHLAKDMHGALGVYPAHFIVDEIRLVPRP